MDADKIISAIGTILSVATKAMEVGADMKPFAELIFNDLVNKKSISPADLANLRQRLSELEARALAPLPPAEPDEI